VKRTIEVQSPASAPERQELDTDVCWVRRGTDLAWIKAENGSSDCVAVTISPRDDGVWVRVGAEEPQPLVHEGVQHSELVVPWGGEVYFSNIRLTFLQETDSENQPRPVFLVALLLALACGGFSLMQQLSAPEASSRDVAAPALAKAAATCPDPDPNAALNRAESAERSARAKQQRFVFDSSDGLEALGLLQQARACYDLVGAPDARQRAAAELEQWTLRMNQYYVDLRMQLRVALDQRRVVDALRANRELSVLLADQADDPYAKWLGELRGELERKARDTRR
jgi:hypothetical protein